MGKDNLIFKLDNLEYQIHYMNNEAEQFHPRFKQTLQFFNSKSRKTNKKVTKLVEAADKQKINEEIRSLRLKILDQKIHHVLQRLQTHWIKNPLILREPEVAKIGAEQFIKYMSYSKLVKLTMSLMGGNKTCPEWFREHEFYQISNNKTNELNPSRIYNEVFSKNKLNSLISKLLNNKNVKDLIQTYENGIHVILNEKDKIQKDTTTASTKQSKTKSEDTSTDKNIDGVSKTEKGATESESESDLLEENSEREAPELDSETEELLSKQYDGLLVGSDEESEPEFHLDPTIDYNQVTDEEGKEEYSDDEDDEENSDSDSGEPSNKKPKYNLPELMNGYISGDGEDDLDDKVARKQIAAVPVKKNRRGQRARQKIWEKKYGSQAKHVQRQLEKEHKERETRQQEYEQRQAKREAKAAQLAEQQRKRVSQYNSQSSTSNIPPPQPVITADKPIHPSWEAKKIAEEKQKNVKFQGKKITFG
ncbi:Bud22 [Kluyveromyces lactis]|nr:Bud22 [Kluyveromyces lactis]